MQQLIYFFQKFKYFLFFILLQFIAITITFNNLNFHKSKYVNSANFITGGFYNKVSNLSSYLNLRVENENLVDENTKLKNQLEYYISKSDSVVSTYVLDSVKFKQEYSYLNAKVIKNDYHKTFNFLLINRGISHGLKTEMAVINSKGIIGITENTKNNYTRVKSILSENSKINARLKNSFYFGTLTWDGKDYNTIQLLDIPRQAVLKVGDTIETGGKSIIFPEGIPIGTIAAVSSRNTTDNKIDVTLFNDMSNLGLVYVVNSFDKKEIRSFNIEEDD